METGTSSSKFNPLRQILIHLDSSQSAIDVNQSNLEELDRREGSTSSLLAEGFQLPNGAEVISLDSPASSQAETPADSAIASPSCGLSPDLAASLATPAMERGRVQQTLEFDSPGEDMDDDLVAALERAEQRQNRIRGATPQHIGGRMLEFASPVETMDDDSVVEIVRPQESEINSGSTSGRRRRRSSSSRALLAAAGAEGDVGHEDADLRLARAMQEQECALMLLQQQQPRQERNTPGHIGITSLYAHRREDQAKEGQGQVREPRGNPVRDSDAEGEDDVAVVGGSDVTAHRGEAAQEGAEGGGEELGMSDEEFARRLQEEEEQAMAQRLLAMAGVRGRGMARPGVVLGDFLGGQTVVGGMPMPMSASMFRGEVEEEEEEDEDGDFDSEEDEDDEEFNEDDFDEGLLDVDNMTYEELMALGEAIGTETKGLPDAVIACLPRSTFLATDHLNDERSEEKEGDDEICAICRCEFEDRDKLILLPPCQHSYHVDCITQWLNLNKVCPICKSEVQLTSAKKHRHKSHRHGAKTDGSTR